MTVSSCVKYCTVQWISYESTDSCRNHSLYLLTWGLGHLRCLVLIELNTYFRHDILAQLHQVACDCRLDDCDWRLWTVTVDSRARFLLFVFWPWARLRWAEISWAEHKFTDFVFFVFVWAELTVSKLTKWQVIVSKLGRCLTLPWARLSCVIMAPT